MSRSFSLAIAATVSAVVEALDEANVRALARRLLEEKIRCEREQDHTPAPDAAGEASDAEGHRAKRQRADATSGEA